MSGRYRVKPYMDSKWGSRFRFFPRHLGREVKAPRCMRATYIGGVIFHGRLSVCDYRHRPGLDRSRFFRKAMGNRVEWLKRNLFGRG